MASIRSETINSGGTVNVPVKVKLPPLMVKAIPLSQLTMELKVRGIQADFKLCSIGTKVVVHSRRDFDRTSEYLKHIKAEFFSHDIPGEKPFKIILRGLPETDTNDLITELREHYKLSPVAVHRIVRRDEKTKFYRDRLYLIHFKRGTVTLNSLQAIRSLFSIIIKWEPYRGGNRDVTQCQRCLNFGHGTRNCNMAPRCNTCAQYHHTMDCPVEGAVAIKCANCGGGHLGSDKQCPKREKFKHIRKQASASNQQKVKRTSEQLFKADDFPMLNHRNSSRGNVVHTPTVNQWLPPPPKNYGPTTPTPEPSTKNANLFSSADLMEIFINMTTALRQCRSKSEQMQVLGTFIIQYGA